MGRSTYKRRLSPARVRIATTVSYLEKLAIAIDIKPGETPNCINNNGQGVIPVAIWGSASFDASQIDSSTIELEG